MMEENPVMHLGGEEMENSDLITLDLDILLDVLEADLAETSFAPNDNPAEGEFGPLQPEIEYNMPPGAVPLSLLQPVLQPVLQPGLPVLPAPEFNAAQTSFPLDLPYNAPYEESFGPQQPQTELYMNLGSDPFSLQDPVMPALAPPMYQPPNYIYCQADPFNPNQLTSVQVMALPQALGTNLAPIGIMNGGFVYAVPAYAGSSDTPDAKATASQRKKFQRNIASMSKPYVKKPPNAFMIFRKEQRSGVVAELQNPDCAPVNRIIGQRWQSMPKEEQANYYKLAEKERQLHAQRFPEWTACDNYGVKKKRIRRKGPAKVEDSSV